jgi:predicted O-methyltransferase YrrM
MQLVEEEQPRRLLEIGTHLGGSLYLLLHAAPDDAHFVSVDLPFRAVPDGVGWVGYRRSRRRLYRSFTRPSQRLTLIQRDSHDPRTVAEVERTFTGLIDFAFIDGWHSYEGARGDFELYRPLIRSGGVVAFHDIWPGPHAGDVPRLWNELKGRYESWELVDDPDQSSFGIGVLRV